MDEREHLAEQAFDPVRAGGDDVATQKPDRCRNCGTALTGPYCYRCGQAAHPPFTLRLWLQAVAWPNVVRFGNSLRELIVRPGALTQRYIAGERVRFVGPVGLFLFGFVALFVALHLTGIGERGLGPPDPAISIARAERDLRETVDQADAEQKTSAEPPAARSARDSRIERGLSAQFFLDQARTAWEAGERGGDSGQNTKSTPRAQLRDPATLADAALAGAPTLGWILLITLTPALWLLCRRRQPMPTLYDPAVAVAYAVAFGQLLAAVLIVAIAAGVTWSFAAALLAVVWLAHGWLQLRGAYALTPAAAVWRVAMLALIIAAIGAILTVAIVLLAPI